MVEHHHPDPGHHKHQKRNSLVEEPLVRPALKISHQQGHEPHQHDHADHHHGHDHHPDDQKRNGLVERRLVRPTLHLSYSRLRPQHEHGPGQHEHNFLPNCHHILQSNPSLQESIERNLRLAEMNCH